MGRAGITFSVRPRRGFRKYTVEAPASRWCETEDVTVQTALPETGRFSETDDDPQPQKKLCQRAPAPGFDAGLLRVDRAGQLGQPTWHTSQRLVYPAAVRFN